MGASAFGGNQVGRVDSSARLRHSLENSFVVYLRWVLFPSVVGR